jgi:hypothetical protein
MGGACGTYGERAEVLTGFRFTNMRKRDHSEELVVEGRIILNGVFKN